MTIVAIDVGKKSVCIHTGLILLGLSIEK